MVEKSEIRSTEVDKMEVDSIDSLLTDKPLRKKLAFETSIDESRFQSVKTLNKLCTHSADGYEKTIEILDQHKSSIQAVSKYKFIVLTLQLLLQVPKSSGSCKNYHSLTSHEKEDYVCELLKLINNIIHGCTEVQDRIRIRSELFTSKLTDAFKTIVKTYPDNEPINEQIDSFVRLRNLDECAPSDVDLNNHFDIFNAICSQVLHTQNAALFISTLRHLLKIDGTNKLSTFIWEVIEKLVCRATLLDREEHTLSDALERYTEEKFKNLMGLMSTKQFSPSPCPSPSLSPPPPAPPLPATIPTPPPPPPPPPFSDAIFADAASQLNAKEMPKKTDESASKPHAPHTDNSDRTAIREKLPQQCVPKAQSKMKQFIWSKIQQDRIVGKQSIWTKFKSNYALNEFYCETNSGADRDEGFFHEIEDFFKTSENPRAESQYKDPNLKETKVWNSSEKINLLDGKRSLNINIYLKQFRCSPDEIIDMLSKNENKQLGLENLEGMLKILPDANEIDLLKMYQGDIHKLGEAEQFLFQLIQVENYMLRIESLLLKEEFGAQMVYFNKYFENIFKVSELIFNSSSLANIMLHICRTGNFINDGNFSGNAAGFKLSSLIKLSDLKSNKHNVTLLHVILQQLEEVNSPLVHLPKELSPLKEVSSLQLDNFKNEISSFCARVKKLSEQIEPVDDSQLKNLKEFLKSACGAIHLLEKKQSDLNGWKTKLAEYFCEDNTYFKLEECFSTLFKFCDRIKKCLQENQERRCSELKRSSSIRGSRRFLGNPGEAAGLANTNNSVQKSLNRRISSSIGRYSMVIDNQINNLVDLTPEFQSTSAILSSHNLLADDLDNYAAGNEVGSFFRRSSSRVSRKSSVTKVIPGFDEQSRELLNSRSSFRNFFKDQSRDSNYPSLDQSYVNQHLEKPIVSTVQSARDTPVGPEIAAAKEPADLTSALDAKVREFLEPTESKTFVVPVVLRRSQSTSEYETNYKPLFRGRRDIPSAANLSEEIDPESQVKLRNQSKSSNRLSGLKKLGSLYKTFEEDDGGKSGKTTGGHQFEEKLSFRVEDDKSANQTREFMSNSLMADVSGSSAIELARKSNLESKRALFEAKKRVAEEEATQQQESQLNNNEKYPTQMQSPTFNRTSKLRHTVHQNASNLVTNRIIKFESRNEIAQKYLGAEDPVLAKSSPADDLVSMKRVSSIRIDPLINDTTSHVNEPNNPDYVNKLKKEKVKSMSKNWEQITESKSKNQPIKMINSFAFTSPTNICEKIEKFNSNNLIQLISKQPNNEAHKPKKNRNNSSCTTNSDDNETSKDDGFETQSNASSSQNSDSNLMAKSISENSHKLAAYLAYTNNCAFLPDGDNTQELIQPHDMIEQDTSASQPVWIQDKSSPNSTAISDESMLDSSVLKKPNEKSEKDSSKSNQIEKCSTSRSSKSLKQIKQSKSMINKQQQQQPTSGSGSSSTCSSSSPVLTNSPRSKTMFRPVSAITITSSCHTPPLQKKIMQGGISSSCSSSSIQSLSINKKTLSNSNLSSFHNIHGQRNLGTSTKNSSTTNSNMSLNDSLKKQTCSQLYLNDTASTKAKRSEAAPTTKNRDSVCSISRGNSLRKKTTSVLASSSTISLPNKDHVADKSVNSVFERLAKKDSPRKA